MTARQTKSVGGNVYFVRETHKPPLREETKMTVQTKCDHNWSKDAVSPAFVLYHCNNCDASFLENEKVR